MDSVIESDDDDVHVMVITFLRLHGATKGTFEAATEGEVRCH